MPVPTVPPRRSAPTLGRPVGNGPQPPGRTAAADSLPVVLVRTWQHRCLIAGGVLFALGNALHPLEHDDAAYRTATWEASHLIILAALPLLVFGLPVVHARLRERVSEPLALLPVIAAIVGLIGLAPGLVIETFVAPEIGHEAMSALERGGMGALNAVFGLALLGGSLSLAWAARRGRLAPSWAAPVLLVATAVLILSMGLTGPLGGAVIIAGTVAYGLAVAAFGTNAH
jgi:hypothetical protein